MPGLPPLPNLRSSAGRLLSCSPPAAGPTCCWRCSSLCGQRRRGKDKVALWLYVDDDDQVTRAAIDGGKFPELGFPVHWHIGPRTPDWGQTYQVLWTALGRTAEVYMIANDDVRFETKGWDEVLRDRGGQVSGWHPAGVPVRPGRAGHCDLSRSSAGAG